MIIWNLNLVITFFLVGLIWTIQQVQYPGFLKVPSGEFNAFHRHHCRSIARIVLPAMLLQLFLALVLVFPLSRLDPPIPAALGWSNLTAVSVVWVSTIWIQAPLHRQLAGTGWDPVKIRSLIAGNWIRTAAWSFQGFLLLIGS